jgi:putative SOS response-associated peptidase YedK
VALLPTRLGVGVGPELADEHACIRLDPRYALASTPKPQKNLVAHCHHVSWLHNCQRCATYSDPFQDENDRVGNLPPLPAIFPDQTAPIIRVALDGERELVMARWGMPGPLQFGAQPVTNIRNVKSPHWRGWLGQGSRCIVPATSFCEYADTKPRKTPIWFALGNDRPLFAFAGLWTPWRGVRGPKSAPVDGEYELFGFLTTEANAIVAPIHPKAMPVILTSPAEGDLWLSGETTDALALQRPLSDDALRIVARGERADNPVAEPALPSA